MLFTISPFPFPYCLEFEISCYTQHYLICLSLQKPKEQIPITAFFVPALVLGTGGKTKQCDISSNLRILNSLGEKDEGIITGSWLLVQSSSRNVLIFPLSKDF